MELVSKLQKKKYTEAQRDAVSWSHLVGVFCTLSKMVKMKNNAAIVIKEFANSLPSILLRRLANAVRRALKVVWLTHLLALYTKSLITRPSTNTLTRLKENVSTIPAVIKLWYQARLVVALAELLISLTMVVFAWHVKKTSILTSLQETASLMLVQFSRF